MPANFDGDLRDWADIQAEFAGGSLLIGNGASCAVWEKFSYTSLYDLAKDAAKVAHPVDAKAQQLFDELGTHNFEEILLLLSRAKLTCATLGMGQPWLHADLPGALDAHYKNIKDALVEAVHSVHIPWNRLSTEILEKLGREFLRYDSVFSTNYDLLLYWAVMQCKQDHNDERDFFWGQEFDLAKAESWQTGSETKTYYLHGGLHLYRTAEEKTLKRQKQVNENLLTLFGKPFDGAEPLFVSEATWQQKFKAIRRSDYLTFAFTQLVRDKNPLTIFGNSLGDNDQHIAKAICGLQDNWTRRIAIGMRPSDDANSIAAKKAAITERLTRLKLRTIPQFFDSTTHPLGAADLKVPVRANP